VIAIFCIDDLEAHIAFVERIRMTLAPLLNASPAIQLHAVAAMAAFALGLLQFAAPKGTIPHRTVGWIWVVLMTIVGVSAFFIHEIRLWGPWSPIHLLAIFTLVMLPFAVLHARKHRVPDHKWAMVSILPSCRAAS
jgi:uncharacterized membrane protein